MPATEGGMLNPRGRLSVLTVSSKPSSERRRSTTRTSSTSMPPMRSGMSNA
jgi:hypothetical protein